MRSSPSLGLSLSLSLGLVAVGVGMIMFMLGAGRRIDRLEQQIRELRCACGATHTPPLRVPHTVVEQPQP